MRVDTDVSDMAAYCGYRRQCYGGILWIQTSVLWRHTVDTDFVSVMAAYAAMTLTTSAPTRTDEQDL